MIKFHLLELRKTQESIAIEDILKLLVSGSSSVLLNWGEDDNLWECSFISGGIRFTGVSRELRMAIVNAIGKLAERLEKEL